MTMIIQSKNNPIKTMPFSKYSESSSESRELLKQAIAFIGTHQLSANPVNYTVCYDFLQGTHPVLKQEIDKAIADKQPLTDQMMNRWFQTYLSEYDLKTLQQSQTDLIEVISTLNETTRQAEENVSEFGHTLRQSEQQLIDPDSPLESVVAHLLASTQSIQASMELMRHKIHESREEINTLRSRLEKISEEAQTDVMTGLANRKGLALALENTLQAMNGSKLPPCILMIDIDHFKKINDGYGHLLGDQVIKVVANNLKNQIKGKDTAARYGGEEFCVLLPETQLSDALKVAENIRQVMEKTRIKRTKDNQEICSITVSTGVTRYQQGESLLDFFQRADDALYESKKNGRNRVTSLE
jgi:diguanylate cyclase